MNWFPLPIFPEGSLASSVVTTAWVGVCVFSIMNLRFGWAFSGLVVPGYLVPLLIVKPWAAMVVIAESMLTYWTVYGLIAALPRLGLACAFFGRDRFMAMIIVSAIYRVVLDAWALPALGAYLNSTHGIHFDYANNLHSFGLIVICLAANQLWKTGVLRGFVPFAFNIAVTYIIVRFVLMEFTNFSISNLSFLYEDIAASIYAAPKAYIVLVTTAILASRMNLLYGWDFNGIMIPALIALQWYEPTKVLTSVVEAIIILGASVLVLRLPFFAAMTMEGARKLLLFFSVSFAYKMVVGWILLATAPELKVSDFYGFGYLLPTLMAIKMHQLNKVAHQLRITVQISLVSIVVANVIGFSLTLIPGLRHAPPVSHSISDTAPVPENQLIADLDQDFIGAHGFVGSVPVPPSEEQLFHFIKGLELFITNSTGDLSSVRQELALAGFRVDRYGSRYLLVRSFDDVRQAGRPTLLIDLETSSRLMVTCSRQLSESGTHKASRRLFHRQQARVLYLSEEGSPQNRSRFQRRRLPHSWLAHAVTILGQKGTIAIRAAASGDTSRLYVQAPLPLGLNLKELESQFGTYDVLWQSPPDEPLRPGSVHWWLTGENRLASVKNSVPVTGLEGTVEQLVLTEMADHAAKSSDLYQKPTPEELLHIDRNLLRPLFALGDSDQLARTLASLQTTATIYGYTISAYHDDSDHYVLLKEEDPYRHWGSILLRVGGVSGELVVEVPSRVEDRSLLTFASTLFQRKHGRMILLSSTNTLTNSDGTTNFSAIGQRESFFNLTHQAYVRSAREPTIIFQCRAFLPAQGEPYPDGDLVVAPYRENRSSEELEKRFEPFLQMFQDEGISLQTVKDSDASSPYAVGVNAQAKYLDFSESADFAILWLSPFLRENFRWQEDNAPLLKALRAIGIDVRTASLTSVLETAPLAENPHSKEAVKETIREFRLRSDILLLHGLSQRHQIEAILDVSSRQLFLVIDQALVANLARHAFERSLPPSNLSAFIATRASWLEHPTP